MAGRSAQSFQKRQKEMQRKEKQQEKLAKKQLFFGDPERKEDRLLSDSM